MEAVQEKPKGAFGAALAMVGGLLGSVAEANVSPALTRSLLNVNVDTFRTYLKRCRAESARMHDDINTQAVRVDGWARNLDALFNPSNRKAFVVWLTKGDFIADLESELRGLKEGSRSVASVEGEILERFAGERRAIVRQLMSNVDLRAQFGRNEDGLSLAQKIEFGLLSRAPVKNRSDSVDPNEGNWREWFAKLSLLVLTEDDLRRHVRDRKPTDAPLTDEARERRIAEIETQLETARLEYAAADQKRTEVNGVVSFSGGTSGRYDGLGRDIWYAHFYWLRRMNARASAPCDHCGRKLDDKNDKDKIVALAGLGIQCAQIDGEIFVPNAAVHPIWRL